MKNTVVDSSGKRDQLVGERERKIEKQMENIYIYIYIYIYKITSDQNEVTLTF
jgi:hypothetical protein